MTPLAAAEAALAADRAYADPALWITRMPDAAVLERARVLTGEGPRDRPLWGVPFAVKDNLRDFAPKILSPQSACEA